ncbi:MAG: DUF4394 domain-containing protein [Beijerinckiaceae bacterium]|nr:DUF4394 domain-containing protein [Beijerinckiaceae bacterium]
MKRTLVAALLASSAAFAGAAQAQTVAALVGDDTLAMVDVKAAKVTKSVKITGASGKILGIDVRPADGMLYALAADGTVYTVDTAGKATMKSKLETTLASGVMATVDFNPVADRLRVIGSDGMNLRANVDDGKVTTDGKLNFAEKDMHKGETPMIVAGAYTNSVKGAKETTLFDVDSKIGALIKQAPPNDGVLSAVGKFGVTASSYAFDIVTMGDKNAGYLMAGDTLYSVSLETGKATSVSKIGGVTGAVRDIAIMPAM